MKEDIEELHRSVKTDDDIETAIKKLLEVMTLEEKLGQLQQISYSDKGVTPSMETVITQGQVGSFLNCYDVDTINQIQKISMENSRLKIPLLIGKDVIHGYRSIFPIPLAQASSFDPVLVEKCARAAAVEASSCGIRWTFSPMVDIARDGRWGRIAEGCGEDPYLAGQMGAAMVRGYQTSNLKDITAIAACGKHYVGYGATEGGRDYNTTLIPENTLRDIYLTPFKELLKNDCQSYMSAFNDLNGVPASGNEFTLKQVLRKEWGFNGLVVSDYNAVSEMIVHGFCADTKEAAFKGFGAGVDMEMVSDCFVKNLPALVTEGKIREADIDTSVANILRVKFKLDLFNNYYTDPARQSVILSKETLELAKQLATKSAVMLKNNKSTLPIVSSTKTLAVIGPLSDDQENQIGCWAPDAQAKDSVTVLTSLKAHLTNTTIHYAKGLSNARSTDTTLFAEALTAAKNSEKVILVLGEDNGLSGESNSRAFINLPGAQEALIAEIVKAGKPIVLVIYGGRPMAISSILNSVDSIVYAWHLGTMAGPALTDLLCGVKDFTGRMPVSLLKDQGQIPLYYNTLPYGQSWATGYIDMDNKPLFNFGSGLSYSTISFTLAAISKSRISYNDSLDVYTYAMNTSTTRSTEQPVMLFIRDLVASYIRPITELKRFQLISLAPNETKKVLFTITAKDLEFWTKDNVQKAEPGVFMAGIGNNADTKLTEQF